VNLPVKQILQLDGETGARARSAQVGDALYFANIPDTTFKNIKLVYFLSGRVKHSGLATEERRVDVPFSDTKSGLYDNPWLRDDLGATIALRMKQAAESHESMRTATRGWLFSLQEVGVTERQEDAPHPGV
jgi:hypothetical protein